VKFSVLLPTRNRANLVANAIETVRRQDFGDWEIVVSDNASEDDTEAVVKRFGDPRIKYHRTASYVPVTENWNRALELSSGDYVVMLGDDDGLLRGCLSTLARLADAQGTPDVLSLNALLYAYPGVLPPFPDGFLQPYGYAEFLEGATEPFVLDAARRKALLAQSMSFHVRFGFNMQFWVVHRRLVQRLAPRGPFFQSPYPDYYAANALLHAAERIVVVPEPLVVIGISPKSFGFFYFNEREREGVEFLQNTPDGAMLARLSHVVLPGTNMNTSWLLAMEHLRESFRDEADLPVDHARYRWLQTVAVYRRRILSLPGADDDVRELRAKLTAGERRCTVPLAALAALARILPQSFRRRAANVLVASTKTHIRFDPPRYEGTFPTILDVYDAFDPERGLPFRSR
jgi:glycosyltransferase involved in cell wall biosynthesis